MKQALMMIMALMLGIASRTDAEEGFRYFGADTRVYGSCRVYTLTDKMGLKAPSVQMLCGDWELGISLIPLRSEGSLITVQIVVIAPERLPKISECSEHTGECVVPVRFSHWSTARNWISYAQERKSTLQWFYAFPDVDFVEHARKADYLHVAFGGRMLRIPLDGFTAAYADFSARLGQ